MNPVGSPADRAPHVAVPADRALRVTVPTDAAEEAGAVLMDAFGPFEEVRGPVPGADAREVTLVFYPAAPVVADRIPSSSAKVVPFPSPAQVLSLLPPALRAPGLVRVEVLDVARDWVDGWKAHFRPIEIGFVRIRPPWEAPLESPASGLVEVVINPGLGFGTGLHPTTRGTLQLLQEGGGRAEAGRGRLLDAGTGSGVLAIAAARLGWRPVVAFDNDPVALISARENVTANGVAETVELREAGVEQAPPEWWSGATVLANMTLEPVLALLDRLVAAGSAGRLRRLVVSGILAGAQEQELLRAALAAGLSPSGRVYETEWVSVELLPVPSSETAASSATAAVSGATEPPEATDPPEAADDLLRSGPTHGEAAEGS